MKKKRRKKILPFFALVFLISILCVVVFLVSPFRKMIKNSMYVSPLPSVQSAQIKITDDGFSKRLSENLSKNHISYSSILYTGNSTYGVKLGQNQEILFTSSNALDSQMSSLQLILSSLTIEGKKYQKIDLRFDKPVIIFQ